MQCCDRSPIEANKGNHSYDTHVASNDYNDDDDGDDDDDIVHIIIYIYIRSASILNNPRISVPVFLCLHF